LGDFLALMPQHDCRALNELAALSVKAFESFRAPVTAKEYQCRKPDSLTERQRRLLDDWGYPYVLDEFRFHMTLTDKCPQDVIDTCRPQLQDYLADALNSDFEVNQLSLLEQQDRQSPFFVVRTTRLTG